MLVQCLHNNEAKICTTQEGLRAVWRQVCTASDDCRLFGRLSAYILQQVRYAKDKGAFITARQRVGQTKKELRQSESAHGRYISL